MTSPRMEGYSIFCVLDKIGIFVQHYFSGKEIPNLNLDLRVARPWLTGWNISPLHAGAIPLKNFIMLTQTH